MSTKTKTEDNSTIGSIVERSFLTVGIGVFFAAFIAAAYLDFESFRADEVRLLRLVHETVSEFVTPALGVSDSTEIIRILGLVSKDEGLMTIINEEGNIYLSDYSKFPKINEFLPSEKNNLTCEKIRIEARKKNINRYKTYCSEIIKTNNNGDSKIKLGLLISLFDYKSISFTPHLFGSFLGIAVMTLLSMLFWIRRILKKKVINPLLSLEKQISSVATNPLTVTMSRTKEQFVPREIEKIGTSFELLLSELHAALEKRIEAERKGVLFTMATQVAHDIRSPLAALQALDPELTALPQRSRLILKSAVSRIQDIANHLITKNRSNTDLTAVSAPDSSKSKIQYVSWLPGLIDSLMTEKRLEHQTHTHIKIESIIDADAHSVFTQSDPATLKRILSNLINNAVESFADSKQASSIKVSLTADPSNPASVAQITIQDNGRGIPPEILPKLTERGATYGKSEGSGLGLWHARTTLESWGGSLQIESHPGKGTQVRLSIPRSPTPSWFVSEIEVQSDTQVVIFDDDESIHQVWNSRFAPTQPIHFYTPGPLTDYVTSPEFQIEKHLFLVDYEIQGYSQNGIELITGLGIQSRSILVTSHHEDPQVTEACLRHEIRLLPKNLAGWVPIRRG